MVTFDPSESFAVFLKFVFDITSIVDVSWCVLSNLINWQSTEEFSLAGKHFTHP